MGEMASGRTSFDSFAPSASPIRYAGVFRGGCVSPRAARTCHHPAAYFRPRPKHVRGFGHNGSRGRDPSRRWAHTPSLRVAGFEDEDENEAPCERSTFFFDIT
jgi:hypothetical protein